MSDYYKDYRHGGEHWATDRDCASWAGPLSGNGICIGQSPQRGFDMTLDGDSPSILFGGSGCGKTRDLIMYSAFYKGSLFILDPKGEISAVTADFHRKTKEVYFINPANLLGLGGQSVNLLDILSAESFTLTSDIHMIMEALIPTREGIRDDFFEATARIRAGLILKNMVLREKKKKVTLLDLNKVLGWLRGYWDGFLTYAREQLLTSPDETIRISAGEIIEECTAAPRQFKGFIGTLSKSFAWLEDSAIQKCVGGDDFSLSVLSERPSVVFLMVPTELMSVLQPFLRLSLTIPVIYKQRRPQASAVTYLLDEMATMGKSEMAERLYSIGRGSGNRVFGVFQSIGQCRKIYGPSGPQIFLSSSQARLFKGIRDLETAELVSKMLGNQTLAVENPRYQAQARHARQAAVNRLIFGGGDVFELGMELSHWQNEFDHRDLIKRALLLPSEILSLPEDRMITFISGKDCPAILGRTTPYYKRRDLAHAFKPNPYYS